MPPHASPNDARSTGGTGIAVLIAAWNEQDRIGKTLRALRSCDVSIAQIVVVDDGSTDATAAESRAAGATSVLSIRHGGKGAAVMAGIPLITADVVLLVDADLGDSAVAATKLITPLVSGEADLAIAVLPGAGGPRRGRGIVVRLARWGIRALTGFTTSAPLSGQRAIRSRLLPARLPRGWGVEVTITIEALQRGARVVEIPVDLTHRVTGNDLSGRLHRARQLADVVTALARMALIGGGRKPPANRW